MSEVKFEVEYEQIDYDEFKRPVAYTSVKAETLQEAIKCLRSVLSSLEQTHVANPIG